MSRLLPIQSAYKTLLQQNRLSVNKGQAALVDRLAQLQQVLVPDLHHLNRGGNNAISGTTISSKDNGVYIYGDVGTGKSRIADLFLATLPDGITKRRIHFYEFMMDTHARVHRANQKFDYRGDPLVQIGRELSHESRVLCFDEFQVSDIADAMILKRLFGAFWDSGGVMVSTSNRHPTRLYENGLNRPLFVPFIEELQRRCDVWEIEGKQDYRMSSKQHQDASDASFFMDEGEFLTSLRKATNDQPLSTVKVRTITNRDLIVQATQTKASPTPEDGVDQAKEIVYATFDSLCKANLGSIDYHSLCKYASAIYISGLRQFARDELDFIRRFIILVDIAYESRTKLVCHSDVPLLKVFENVIVPPDTDKRQQDESRPVLEAQGELRQALLNRNVTVKGEGGSSSSMMSTFIGDVEWSATGLAKASLASGGAGETDVRFAVGRAISRLFEMNSVTYGVVG